MVYKSGQIFLPFCHNPRVWRTDRQTDRILIARPRLHCMQRGKNGTGHRYLSEEMARLTAVAATVCPPRHIRGWGRQTI